jgi:ribosome biogenesis GTPase A
MVSLAKASVLFGERDAFRYEVDSKVVTISKRGWTELLACAAIDSFAQDEAGIDEWSAVLNDFAASAHKRFESFAQAREAGYLFGLFGVDADAARAGRELAAKARFLAAKVRLRAVNMGESPEADEQLRLAVEELESSVGLTEEERFQAVLEQAQFHARAAQGPAPRRGASVRRALWLMDRAAAQIEPRIPALSARTRAEAAAFALELLPSLVAGGEDVTILRSSVEGLLDNVAVAVEGPARSLAMAPVAAGWVQEQRFRLASALEGRAAAIERAHDAYLRADEPVAAMYCALRLAYLAVARDGASRALDMLIQDARRVVTGEADPVSRAFAAKYLLKASEVAGRECPDATWEQAGEWFLAAAEYVAASHSILAFHLHGRAVLHREPTAVAILRAQAAQLLARAGRGTRAVVLLEVVRTELSDVASEAVQLWFDLERAEILLSLDHTSDARGLLEGVERQARMSDQTGVHRRALELLHAMTSRPIEAAVPTPGPTLAVVGQNGMMAAYAERRSRLIQAGNALIGILRQPGILARIEHGPSRQGVLAHVQHRLQRVEESRFRIAIVGEFSSGKSTFLNALLGEAILPSSVRPTTAAPNRIRWGAQPGLRVHYVDGRADEASLDDLANFVTERANPGNKRKVDHVEIRYPLGLLRDGVELLDTPGISSLVEAHTRTTYEILPTCDAVVLLATGRQPFSESIGTFLQDLRMTVEGKVFYVLNKIDQVDLEKRSQSVEFATRWVADKVEGARVLPVSAYQALVGRRLLAGTLSPDALTDDPRVGGEHNPSALIARSGMRELEDILGHFLLEYRGGPLIRSVAGDLLMLLQRAEGALNAERQAGQMSTAERLETHRKLAADLQRRRAKGDESVQSTTVRLRGLVEEVAARARVEIPALVDSILDDAQIQANDITSADNVRILSERISALTRKSIRRWVDSTCRDTSARLASVLDEARQDLAAMRRDLRVHFGSILRAGSDELPDLVGALLLVEVESTTGETVAIYSAQMLLSFIGGFFVGPLAGVLAGSIGGAVVRVLFGTAEERAEKARSKVKPRLSEELERIGVQIGESLKERFSAVTREYQSSLEMLRSEILADFDQQLNTLITIGEQSEADARNAQRLLRQLQEQAAKARETLSSLVAEAGET